MGKRWKKSRKARRLYLKPKVSEVKVADGPDGWVQFGDGPVLQVTSWEAHEVVTTGFEVVRARPVDAESGPVL